MSEPAYRLPKTSAAERPAGADPALHVQPPIALKVYWSDGAEPSPLSFDQRSLVIGRAQGCDLQLSHRSVSPRHAYLQRIGNRILCIDLGSRGGTLWNNSARQRDWVSPDDRISIGPYEIALDATGLPDRRSAPAVDYRRILLRVVSPAPRGQQPGLWPLRDHATLIGRGPDCDIRVGHGSVSRVHCSIVVDEDGVWVRDLLSEAGTWVNGQSVQCARLCAGNELRIGNVLFRVVFDWSSLPAAPNGPQRPIVSEPPAEEPADEDAAEQPVIVASIGPMPPPAEPPVPELEANPGPPEAASRLEALTRTAERAEGTTVSERRISDDLVVALFDHVAEMQNQQTTLITEAFHMQRQYLELLRDELNQARDLKGELKALLAELRDQPGTGEGFNRPRGGEEPPSRGRAGEPRDDKANLQHEWIMQRLAQAQKARSGRWSTLLRTLLRSRGTSE